MTNLDVTTDLATDLAAVQDRFAPHSICFGCGPANERGLRIKSFPIDGGLRTMFEPRPEHQAFTGVLSGGIVGTLVDCHGNWTCAMALMTARSPGNLPSTVTAWFRVDLKRPTPMGVPLVLTSALASMDIENGRAEVDVVLAAPTGVTATGRGLFVAVNEGHPAFHRWD